jgi:hypothetical protein
MIDSVNSVCCFDGPLTRTATDPFLGRGSGVNLGASGLTGILPRLVAASAMKAHEKTSRTAQQKATAAKALETGFVPVTRGLCVAKKREYNLILQPSFMRPFMRNTKKFKKTD